MSPKSGPTAPPLTLSLKFDLLTPEVDCFIIKATKRYRTFRKTELHLESSLKAKDLALKAKGEKIVLKNSLRARPRTSITAEKVSCTEAQMFYCI